MYRSLIIDDEKSVHRVILALGHWYQLDIAEPESAYDGKSGLSAMRELRPDIVFLDMKMPLMSGSEFLKAASPEFPSAKFIVVSGYDEFTYAKIAIQYHVLDYLLKPIVEKELNAALQEAKDFLDREIRSTGKPCSQETILCADRLACAVKDFLDQNYSRDVHLADLTNRFHFSKEYISRLFHEKYQTSIGEYVLKIRMDRAKTLLLNENIQIQNISERLGYKDSNYFSKAFRSYYGVSPSEYKESCKEEEHSGKA